MDKERHKLVSSRGGKTERVTRLSSNREATMPTPEKEIEQKKTAAYK